MANEGQTHHAGTLGISRPAEIREVEPLIGAACAALHADTQPCERLSLWVPMPMYTSQVLRPDAGNRAHDPGQLAGARAAAPVRSGRVPGLGLARVLGRHVQRLPAGGLKTSVSAASLLCSSGAVHMNMLQMTNSSSEWSGPDDFDSRHIPRSVLRACPAADSTPHGGAFRAGVPRCTVQTCSAKTAEEVRLMSMSLCTTSL